jgi:hypothetical protein
MKKNDKRVINNDRNSKQRILMSLNNGTNIFITGYAPRTALLPPPIFWKKIQPPPLPSPQRKYKYWIFEYFRRSGLVLRFFLI